jgi:lambda family phage minor tail protein L
VTNPNTGTNNALVTDLQGQVQASAYLTVFEIELPDSNIGGAGEDKLYFHDGQNGTSNIEWYSLINEENFGSSTATHYNQREYTALPIESEGWEIRGSGTGSLPRPTIRLGNVNQFFNTYLADWDDLVGAKVIRRRTLEKYLGTNPPIEFNRDIFYIERKSSETVGIVEFELVSAFDVEGISLPRRSILAARCPWKYKDTTQGGCDWPEDSRLVEGSAADPLYFDKDDNIIAKDVSSPGALEYTFWGRQDLVANREATLFLTNTSYTVGNYVEYQRPVGSLYAITDMTESEGNKDITITVPAATAAEFAVGDWLIIKGATTTSWNHKNVPLYVESKGGSGDSSTIVVQADNSATGTLSVKGYIQACRNTLYKCKVAHTILSTDSIDDLVKPTNISYWDFGDICGKRLSSCSKRFAHVANKGSVDIVHIKTLTGVLGTGVLQQGSGYTSVPTVGFSGGGGSGASATAVLGTTSGLTDKVVKFTGIVGGSGYTSNPTVTISGGGSSDQAVAEAQIKHQTTDNVALPFGGFPGASFG